MDEPYKKLTPKQLRNLEFFVEGVAQKNERFNNKRSFKDKINSIMLKAGLRSKNGEEFAHTRKKFNPKMEFFD